MAKVGRPRIFNSPDEMWQAFEAYAKEVKANPRKKMVFVGKDGQQDYELLERPLTIEGFKVWAWEEYGSIDHYFRNTDGRYEEFGGVCSHIKETIRRDQIEGGMVGQYNPSITQRLNGLTEKQETTVSGKIDITLDLGE